MRKCIGLIRVSTGHQDLEQQSIKVKEQAIRDGYDEKDIILIEDVESAVKLSEEERNGLNRMKELILNDSSIDCVYAYEISRISRQAKIVFSIRDFLINHHIQLIIMNPFFKMLKDDGTLSETSNIFFGIFASMSENEGYLRKARIKKARDRYVSMGRHVGGNIQFGYKTNYNHEYLVDEVNGEIVRMIFEWYVYEKMSIRRIAKELYERGVKMWTCKTDRKPSSYLTMCTNINNILHRPEYYGAVKGKPAIISKELYDKAQYVMHHRAIAVSRKEVPALLRGMLYDKNNGLLLSANFSTKNYWSKRMKGVSISFECADKIITNFVNANVFNKTKEQNMILISDLRKEYDITWVKENTIRDRKEEVFNSIDRLEERIIMGKINSSLAERLEKKLKDELNELIENADVNFRRRRELSIRMQHLERDNGTMITDDISLEQKQDIIKDMIYKIELDRESRTIINFYIHTKFCGVKKLRVDSYHKKVME